MRLIDADALEFDTEWSEYMDGFTSYSQFQIDNAPTIDAVPVRHAHWVFRDEDKHLLEGGCIPSNMWCSYCNQWSGNDCYGDAYCRNCGARMDEPDLADEIAKEVSEDAGTG